MNTFSSVYNLQQRFHWFHDQSRHRTHGYMHFHSGFLLTRYYKFLIYRTPHLLEQIKIADQALIQSPKQASTILYDLDSYIHQFAMFPKTDLVDPRSEKLFQNFWLLSLKAEKYARTIHQTNPYFARQVEHTLDHILPQFVRALVVVDSICPHALAYLTPFPEKHTILVLEHLHRIQNATQELVKIQNTLLGVTTFKQLAYEKQRA